MSSAKAQDKWTHFSGIAFGGGGRQGLQTGTQALTLSGDTDLALVHTSGATVLERNVLVVDPGGASRNLDLPPEADSDGMLLIIINAADVAGEVLTIRNDANDKTLGELGQNNEALVVCNGTAWYGGPLASGSLSSLNIVADGGTSVLVTNTTGDTTTARQKFQSKSDGAASTVGDMLGVYGVSTLTATDNLASAKTMAGLMGWTEVLGAGTLSTGGTVIAGARIILQTQQDLSPASGRASAIVYAEAWNDATGGDIDAGVYILNNQQTGAKTLGAGVKIHSGDGASGGADFTYGIDMGTAAIGTAHVKLAEAGGNDVVITVGNFTDAAASGFAPGSIGLDTTDGALFVADSSGNWQILAEA